MDEREIRDDLRLNDGSPLFYALLEQNPDEGDGVVDKADYFRARTDFDRALEDDFDRVVVLSGATRDKAKEVLKGILIGYFKRKGIPARIKKLMETHTLSLVSKVPDVKFDFTDEIIFDLFQRIVGHEANARWKISEEDRNIKFTIDSAELCDDRKFVNLIFPYLSDNAVVYEFNGTISFNTDYGVLSVEHFFFTPVKDSITAPVAEA